MNSAKATTTPHELAEKVMKKYPGRYLNIASAKATISYVAKKLGITDVNGKKNYINYSMNDADRIIEYLSLNQSPTVENKDQVSLDEIVMPDEPIISSPTITTVTAITETPDPNAKIYKFYFTARKHLKIDLDDYLDRATTPEERNAVWNFFTAAYQGFFLKAISGEENEPEERFT